MFRIDELQRNPERHSPRLLELSHEFERIVNNKRFPCIFSTLPFATGELYVDVLGNPDTVEKDVVVALRELCAIIKGKPDAVGVIFVEQPVVQSMPDDLRLATRIVQAVMNANAEERADKLYPGPNDPRWMLWLDDTGLFVNFSSPAHHARRSRNVGSAFTIIAQARESFDRQGRSSKKSRAEIRSRLFAYDSVPPHPSLASYGDPENREILQFFLGDGMEPQDLTKVCPR